ncbi:hypothetical protein PY650_14865 [Rhizobium calliandrae]|uniref:Major facilitator superfamily (MFS) profile domain-containing protein n=1 Tax=Rhizobium calliandrae TaxID=1312182 RepID=A0ABT7KE76_9HYPH|nr:hypothetical protein [Rhizobium calliandrae]MDL2406919.1 hypothetical protein [Rhizobium calliandrae]
MSIFGNSIDFVDASIVNVALPTIQLDLAGPLSAVQWLSSACLLALASLVVGGGVLSDRLGTITNP